MIRVGIAGIGFMGMIHFKAWADVGRAEAAAICTRSSLKRRGDWSSVKGNFGPSGGVHDLSHLARYEQFDQLLADEGVDLIDICLPTSVHAATTIRALEAGKHVIVEKPIALTLADAQRMVAAARASGRMLFVAQVLRFCPQWAFLKEAVSSGRFGPLAALNLRRIISQPDWSREVADASFNGGPLIDLHIHDADFLLYLLGRPDSVYSAGIEQDGVIQYVASTYHYVGGPTVTCQCGAVATAGRPFKHEFEACFGKATVVLAEATEPAEPDAALSQSARQVLTVYHPDGTVTYPKVDPADGFVNQLQHVAECLAGGQASTIIGAESARDALSLVLDEGKALRSGSVVALR